MKYSKKSKKYPNSIAYPKAGLMARSGYSKPYKRYLSTEERVKQLKAFANR